MSNKENCIILAIDEDLAPHISVEEAQALKPIQKKFIESYFQHKNSMTVDEWLHVEMAENFPQRSNEEIAQMCEEIISTLKKQEEKKASLEKAFANGRSKESWFAGEMKTATSFMSAQEASKYLHNLDTAINSANESLYRTIHTHSGVINQNPQLDGFIAEQYHAQTFNLNAEARGSSYRAKVLDPSGNGYTKNSVDIVIVDKSGNIVRRYQSKYCKDSEATLKAFDQGDYRGQQKLVPEGQEQGITKKVITFLEAPDGTTSTPLSKERAKELQTEAQSGKWNDLNWNEYKTKDLAIGIGKQSAQAALLGAAVGIGFDVAQKVWKGEKIKGEDLVESAITSGTDFGVKAAITGALKVGSEKEIIKIIPKGTSVETIANVTHIAIENVKIIKKIVTGKLTFREGLEQMEQTTVAASAGIATSVRGAAKGAILCESLGPIGIAAGSFIGGTIGYMAGSKFGETVAKGVQKIRKKAKEVFRSITKTVAIATVDGIQNLCRGIQSLFS